MNKETSLQTLGQRQWLLEWSQKVADCRQSGLSVKRWCNENGTSVKTYYSWQKKYLSSWWSSRRFNWKLKNTAAF